MGIFIVSLIIFKTGFGSFFGTQLSKNVRLNVVEFQINCGFYSLLGEIITLAKSIHNCTLFTYFSDRYLAGLYPFEH